MLVLRGILKKYADHINTKLRKSHTHPFNGPLSGTTRVIRYKKGKTNLDFTGARDIEWQWNQLDHMQVCTLVQTDNHASTHHSVFYRPEALPAVQPTVSMHWRLQIEEITEWYILWNELSWRKLSPMLASAHYSCPYPVGLVGKQLGRNFLITVNVYVDQTLCTILINWILVQIETQRILE